MKIQALNPVIFVHKFLCFFVYFEVGLFAKVLEPMTTDPFYMHPMEAKWLKHLSKV
jgi:hypothetical protein